MKKLLLLFFLLCLPYKAFAGFVDAINCDDIPLAQRNANALICLQSTTAGGRSPGIGYLWNGTVWIQYSNIPRVAVAALPAVPKTGDVVVVTDALNSATCAVAGGIAANICQWTGAAWSPIGGGGGSSGHLFKDETLDLANQPLTYINCTGGGIACTSNVGTNSVDITVTAGAEADPVVGAITGVVKGDGAGNIAAANATDLPYTPAGDIAANTVGGAIAELDKEKQPLDADLTALAGNATVGFWATATNVARSMATASANNITITNPAGVAGNPTWDVGPNVALTTRAFTAGNFDYDFGAAASLGLPRATGAAPTASGRCAYDTTASPVNTALKCGFNGTTLTLATTSYAQPLNANLTAFANLVGVNGEMAYFTGVGTMARTSGLGTPCPATGAQALNLSSLGTFVCGAITTGFAGGVSGTLPVYNSATTAIPSIVTQSGGNVTIGGGLLVNCVADCVAFDLSAYAGHVPYSITYPYVGASASVAMTTGALVNGEVVKVGAAGQLVSGGAAGAGTWTDSSTNTGSNKTLIDVLAGGGAGNVIKSQLVASFDGGALTPKTGSGCSNPPSSVVLNSGDAPEQYVLICPTAATASFGVVLPGIKQAIGTIFLRLKVNDAATGAPDHFAGTFKAQCRASGAAPNSTWGTPQAVDITMTTGLNTYEGVTAALTPNGTCSIHSDLYVQFDADGNMTDAGNARIVALIIEQQS